MTDARTSMMAAQAALPLAKDESKEMVKMAITSAKRRYYVAASTVHLLQAIEYEQAGKLKEAKQEVNKAVEDGQRLLEAARELGIEFPMAVHDDEFVEKLRSHQKHIHNRACKAN